VGLTVASLVVVGGAVFALFTFWPLVLLALIAGLAGLKALTVRQQNPPMNPRRWSDGS
jgi:predicted benzoate:H+ symporter BenE